jgi:hypothetical protein
MNDDFGNKRTPAGLFEEHVVGASTVDQLAAGVDHYDDQFTATDKVKNFQSVAPETTTTVPSTTYDGHGGGAGGWAVFGGVILFLAVGYFVSTSLKPFEHYVFLLISFSFYIVPALCAWAVFSPRNTFSKRAISKLFVYLIFWLISRSLFLGLAVIVDIASALVFYFIISRAKRVSKVRE